MDPEPTFEDALRLLEQTVDDLERGAPELTTALAKYEAGVRLLGQCQSALERAERSVALLTGVDADGNPVTAPFDASATAERPPATPVRKITPDPLNDGDDHSIPL